MPSQPTRFSQLRWLQVLVCIVAMCGGGGLIGLGLLGYGASPSLWLIAGGGFVVFVAVVVLTITPLLLKIESTSVRRLDALRDIKEVLPKLLVRIDEVSENTRISDAAKSLAHREEELQALRQTIRNDIRTGRWDAAYRLVDEVNRRFGHDEEASKLREELDTAREEEIENRLVKAIAMVEGHFMAQEWELAGGEIDRLKLALPDDARVASLQQRMETLREGRKTELRKEWDEAIQRGETDHAIELLKELDDYLSPEDVRELTNVARTVFKEKLLQLGIQFRFAVKEKRWSDALTIGIEMVRDYPNARAAQEVREMLDVLRERSKPA